MYTIKQDNRIVLLIICPNWKQTCFYILLIEYSDKSFLSLSIPKSYNY